MEWTIPAFAFPAKAGTHLPTPGGWKAELALSWSNVDFFCQSVLSHGHRDCSVGLDARVGRERLEEASVELSVASLEWVSPGAASEGVTPIFSWKKLTIFLVITVSHEHEFSGVTPIYFLLKNWQPFFAHHCRIYWFHSGVTPSWRVSLRTFFTCPTSFFPLFSVNLPTNFFLRVSPPGGCHLGGPPPPPPSDDTGNYRPPFLGNHCIILHYRCGILIRVDVCIKRLYWKVSLLLCGLV